MSRITIELPYPPRGLSPNSRLGWRAKAKVVAQYREDAAWHGVEWRQNTKADIDDWSLQPPVEATVTFVVPDRRRRDLDNLLAMLKPAWDGLCDAGVLAGDDSERFKVKIANVRVSPSETRRVLVDLWSMSGAGTTQ